METVLLRVEAVEKQEDTGLVLTTVLLASVAAAAVTQAGLGFSPALEFPDYQLPSLS